MSCVVDPRTGHEWEDDDVEAPAARTGRLLVVGGGPAGLEAARVARLRGHQVRLAEADTRLGGGRRERLRVGAPAVVSVEPSGLRLRRASLGALLAAREAAVSVLSPPLPSVPGGPTGVRRPYRPRPKVLPPPPAALSPRERILAISGALTPRPVARTVVTDDPEHAADVLLGFLRERSYLCSDAS